VQGFNMVDEAKISVAVLMMRLSSLMQGRGDSLSAGALAV
jgi:hypothetical protein